MVLRSEYSERAVAPADNSLGTLRLLLLLALLCRWILCFHLHRGTLNKSPLCLWPFSFSRHLLIAFSVVAIGFFWDSNSITVAFSEMANQCCIVIRHWEGTITAQLVVLSWQFDWSRHKHKKTASSHKYVNYRSQTTLAVPLTFLLRLVLRSAVKQHVALAD